MRALLVYTHIKHPQAIAQFRVNAADCFSCQGSWTLWTDNFQSSIGFCAESSAGLSSISVDVKGMKVFLICAEPTCDQTGTKIFKSCPTHQPFSSCWHPLYSTSTSFLLLSCDHCAQSLGTEVKRRLVRDLAMTSLLTGRKLLVSMGMDPKPQRFWCEQKGSKLKWPFSLDLTASSL